MKACPEGFSPGLGFTCYLRPIMACMVVFMGWLVLYTFLGLGQGLGCPYRWNGVLRGLHASKAYDLRMNGSAM